MDRASLIATLASAKQNLKRPIITLANCDNAWLISIPKPAGAADPWLFGVNDVLISYFLRLSLKEKRTTLDAVTVTHTNPDHLHQPTLRTFDQSLKVFAVQDAAATISAMKHFDNVHVLPDFVRDQAWPATPEMPDWLSIFRLEDETKKYPNLYHAIVIKIAAAGGKDEVFLYCPHGVDPSIVEAAMEMNPDASVLAMTHPINEAAGVGMKSKGYWIHCQEKIQYTGFLTWFFDYGDKTLEIGLEEEAKETEEELPRPNYVTILNGAGFVLA
ncbi:hypothetical protein BDP81DRAFT_482957 [Colletotrichum phormii]|uniref:Uncharacterized protein n=1 Tax=Colletotrichum phormii TaxID=359342 RepID=A0AAJ0EEF6_9PEZI|nr:uncharacterized protein BDP81DRAFT_482957 [Colletotrichum phormii]KAK1633940.1 hypothetical protein BDP81DRAFT_482957 [Colletotrichum phormii]